MEQLKAIEKKLTSDNRISELAVVGAILTDQDEQTILDAMECYKDHIEKGHLSYETAKKRTAILDKIRGGIYDRKKPSEKDKREIEELIKDGAIPPDFVEQYGYDYKKSYELATGGW